MKKIILSLLILISCPISTFADYGMVKMPAQNNLIIPELKTYTPANLQTQPMQTYPIKTAVAVPPAVQMPVMSESSAIMAKLTGSFDDAFSQLINLLSQKDFKIISYDIQKGFVIAQNTVTGDRIFSVLGTYNNQCFVKISCMTSSCSSMSRFSGM